MKRQSLAASEPRVTPPQATGPRELTVERIPLSLHPGLDGPSLVSCLSKRRSTRNFLPEPVTLEQADQLLWAAQGCTGIGGLRTAPSAGAIYPVRSYFLAGSVTGVAPGVYSFDVDAEVLRLHCKGDKRKALASAMCDQVCVEECACALLLTGWYVRAAREFGAAAPRLAAMEAGHIGQNFCLQATALGLGAIGLGRMDVEAVRLLLHLPDNEEPLYLLLAGRI